MGAKAEAVATQAAATKARYIEQLANFKAIAN